MRVLILSDLHIEFADYNVPDHDADLVILAGDIGVGEGVPAWIADQFQDKSVPVAFVAGNHEFYRQNISITQDLFRQRLQPPHYFLENEAVELDLAGERVRVLGATLWTSLIDGYRDASHLFRQLSDYYLIPFPTASGVSTEQIVQRWHQESVAWLDEELGKPFDGKTIVVTHHAPLIEAGYYTTLERPTPFQTELTPAFSTDLKWLIEKHHIDLWAFGHTHLDFDETIAGTRVFSQQRCYPATGSGRSSERDGRGMPAFEPQVIEVRS